jgi:ribonuclease HII
MFNQITDCVTGIDEAGRGCLAGPVVVAAVTWKSSLMIPVADSKELTSFQREELFDLIVREAESYAYVAIDHDIIDKINIRQATLLGMSQSYQLLRLKADQIIIDGIDKPKDLLQAACVVKADTFIPAVSAASIIAKVVRDRMMHYYHSLYQAYHFDQHKGYGTIKHRLRIAEHGPSPIHRLSFKLLANQD